MHAGNSHRGTPLGSCPAIADQGSFCLWCVRCFPSRLLPWLPSSHKREHDEFHISLHSVRVSSCLFNNHPRHSEKRRPFFFPPFPFCFSASRSKLNSLYLCVRTSHRLVHHLAISSIFLLRFLLPFRCPCATPCLLAPFAPAYPILSTSSRDSLSVPPLRAHCRFPPIARRSFQEKPPASCSCFDQVELPPLPVLSTFRAAISRIFRRNTRS
ncbi:hypothetical protein GE09DRAFT_493187 [Coniochaeta sp. 2T2.1]|nr:hypothetical protein GE09DRAFT_493187 [Coniochaeta sp. 2T2.1]